MRQIATDQSAPRRWFSGDLYHDDCGPIDGGV